MKSYLDNRYQRTVIKDNKSNKIFSPWELVRHGVLQGSVLGPLMFLIYRNDFPQTMSKLASLIIFADDTSILTSNPNLEDFKNNVNLVLTELINWFRGNLLTLNYDKTQFLQFLTKKQNEIKLQITASNTIITSVSSTKFLGLVIDSAVSWRDHIIEVTSKLNKACYAIRILKPHISQNMLRMIYFSCVHSVMSYGIIFWGNSHHSINIFKSQKRIVRIMTGTDKRDTCRPLFKKLQILPFPYTLLLAIDIYSYLIRQSVIYIHVIIMTCIFHL